MIEDFKIKKGKEKFSITYHSKVLMTVNPVVVQNIILDFASKKFLAVILENISKPIKDSQTIMAIQLAKAYITRKQKFYGSKKLSLIDKRSKDFKHMVKAVEFIERHETNYNTFLEAQIQGLGFVNNGAGVFPKVSQLSSSSAEERLIAHLFEDSSGSKTIRVALTHFDKTNNLKSNPKYQDYYRKMKNNTASLKEAYFVHDCQIVRKEYATDYVLDFIEELE